MNFQKPLLTYRKPQYFLKKESSKNDICILIRHSPKFYVITSSLNISKFWKEFLVASILPKDEQKQVDLRYHSGKVKFVCSFFGRIISLKKSSWLCLTYSDFEYLLGRFDKLNALSEKRYLYYYIIAGRAINFYFLIAAIFLIKINKISKINNFFLLWKQPGKLG